MSTTSYLRLLNALANGNLKLYKYQSVFANKTTFTVIFQSREYTIHFPVIAPLAMIGTSTHPINSNANHAHQKDARSI